MEEYPQASEPPGAVAQTWADLPADYRHRFGGMARLYGEPTMVKFHRATVIVVGVGGVGSWVVESLARSGIGCLRLVDMDDVCITNVNRQLPAMDGEIGRPKIDVLRDRCVRINPGIQLQLHPAFVTPSNLPDHLLAEHAGGGVVVVDCIDRASVKAAMLAWCLKQRVPAVTVGGAGGRRDATAVRVADLTRSEGDPLLKQVRKQLRKNYQLPRFSGKKLGIPTVFSAEPLSYPTEDGSCSNQRPAGQSSLRMDCASGFGAVTHVTAAFGMAAAGQALEMLRSSPG